MKARRRVAGLHAAESALEHSPDKIVTAWLDDRRGADRRLADIAHRLAAQGITAQPTGKSRLDALAEGHHHQGIVLELIVPGELGETDLRKALENPVGLPFFLVLDHAQDPHNLGACLRTADAAGIQGVVLTKDQSVGMTPTVAKVASGAAETVPIYRVTNLARAMDWMKDSGLWLVGAAGEAERTVYELDLVMPLAVVMGAEGKGLRRLTRERCDLLAKIPMAGQVESLNLSVATGVMLFEAVRQRWVKAPG
ncbi:23S rRNA (guanosine(2251)-2'-O)-methyltransferase RlmB [Methylomagnum sp.]